MRILVRLTTRHSFPPRAIDLIYLDGVFDLNCAARRRAAFSTWIYVARCDARIIVVGAAVRLVPAPAGDVATSTASVPGSAIAANAATAHPAYQY